MAKDDFWEADQPADASLPANSGGDFWLDDQPIDAARQELPAGMKPSTAGAGRGTAMGLSDYRRKAEAETRPIGLADIAGDTPGFGFDGFTEQAQPATKRVSVLEGVQLQPDKPWSFREASEVRRAIADTPVRRGESIATPVPRAAAFGMDVRDAVQNPAARGVMAGVAGLGQVLPGAVEAAADFVGADGVADFAGRAARTGRQAAGPLAPKGGSDKLVFDIANSITQTAPTILLGLGGGPAMTALFGQSAAQEYSQGRAAGLDGGVAAARAGIMAGAEVLGERFGFGEQIAILKGLARRMPVDELAPVFARQIMKEIPGEQLTTLVQFLADKAGPGALNPEATLADYLQQAGDTLKVTIGQTAVMGGGPVAISAARNHFAKPADRTPQIERLRKAGDETAAALLEQRQQKERAAYSAEVEAQAVAQINPELAQRYRDVRMAGAKTGDAVVQTAARWNFEQAARLAGLSETDAQAVANKLDQMPPEKAAGFVQKAITGLAQAGRAQPFDGMDTLAQTIEAQRDQMLDSVLATMNDIEALEAQQDAAQAQTPAGPQATLPEAAAAPAAGDAGVPGADQPGAVPALSEDWQQFPEQTGTLNVPRAEMPQVKTVHRGPLTNFLNARGVTHEQVEVDPATLKPTQAEFSQTKVQEAADRDTDRSILISADGHIIDGHHQAIAKLQNGKPVRAIRLNATAEELIPLVREFPSSTTEQADVQDATPRTEAQATAAPVEASTAARGDAAAAAGVPDARAGASVRADGVTNVPGSDAGNGFKQGPQEGERYRVGVSAGTGGVILEKRLPAGTIATFYVGKDGGLVDADDVNLVEEKDRQKLWMPPSKDATDQATAILDEMGKLALTDPRRKDAKARLKALVTATPSPGVPAAPGAGDVQADGVEAPAPGMVRVYHGGQPGAANGDVWFTRSLRDAKGWASRGKGMAVEYVDIPASTFAPDAEFGNLPPERLTLPESIASQRKPLPTTETAQIAANSATTPELLGQNSQPMSEGGKPFKTEAAARQEKKLHPDKRVVKAPGGKGFVLKPMSAKQIAAQEAAARRIRGADTGEKGPLSAHGFILGRGGLARSSMADAGFDKNIRIGNRWLFTDAGKTLAQASEMLYEAGYITEETENAASDIIRRSIASPQYTPEGWDAVAEAEAQTRFEDHLAAQQDSEEDPFASLADHGYTEEDTEGTGYDQASPEIQAEVAALSSQLEAMGEDSESIRERVALQYPNASQQEYHEHLKAAITAAIAKAAQPAGRGDPGQDDGEQGPAQSEGTGESLTDRPDGTLAVKGDTQALRERLTAAGIPTKSILSSATGVVVGKTQAKRARNVLEGRDADKAAPRTLDENGRATDGKPINAGDVFTTLSGRETTPYPKQQAQKFASQWLIDNAIAEARARGDDFNATVFSGEKPLKDGTLPDASRESMLMYLFGEQPAVVPSILKPLVRNEPAITTPKAPAKVTPQIPSSRQLADMIQIAADSIDKLRKPDVDRVLNGAPASFRTYLAMHIREKRPDLADEVREVMDELNAAPALTAPTKADIEAQQARAEQAARDKAAADRAAERTAAQDEDRKRIAKASQQAAETFELGGDAMANLTGQKDIFGGAPEPAQQEAKQPKQADAERFEAGKALTKEQRKTVIDSLVDVYKQKGAAREMKGTDRNGNERYGYVHSPDLFEKSDITGAMVRYYVTLPDGRKAHPTELFPDYTQSDIDAEMEARESRKRDRVSDVNRATVPAQQFSTIREAVEWWDKRSRESTRTASGLPTIFPSEERRPLTNGNKFILVPNTTSGEMLEAFAESGWRVARAAQQEAQQIPLTVEKALAEVEKAKVAGRDALYRELATIRGLSNSVFNGVANRLTGSATKDGREWSQESLTDFLMTQGAPAAPEKPAATKPASKTPTLEQHTAVMKEVNAGTASVESYRASFAAMVADPAAVKAELDTMTKEHLLRSGGMYFYQRYKGETKATAVNAMYEALVAEYALGKDYGPTGYFMGEHKKHAEQKAKALRELVEGQTAETLADHAAEVKKASDEFKAEREAKAKSLENPQSLEDFRALMRKHITDGKTRKEAFLMLTVEQRTKYDELDAESTREAREARKRERKTEVRAAGQTTGGEIIATKHTRDGYDLFVVKLADRLSKEDYTTVLASAKRLGGWYSAFRGNGAIPGFQFKDKANAEAFLKLAGGDTTDAQAQAEQRRDAFEDDRSETAVERLRAMADKLEEQASDIENADRKTNTARRARFAASALKGAAEAKAKAKTMRNIAQAIEDGGAKFLDAVRTKSQVDFLTGMVATAKNNELREKYPSYADQEKRMGEPATAETADFAEFPSFTVYRSDLASLGRQLLEVDGTKKLGQRLMAVADDVTDAYLEFAKQPANLLSLSRFSFKQGEDVKTAIFASRDLAERAIKRSNLTGKAIVLAEKRGVNRIILSPSEAINAGIWTGDGDKRITLSTEFGNELVEAIGRRGNKSNRLTVPWQFQNAYDRLKALGRMGIETASEYRSALREFIGLQERAMANKVKEMELAMVGKKSDGLDFFPTPAEVADQMVEAADIEPGMLVLEPSAGMAHIADRIRAAGAEPDVGELSGDRRELLEEKGYNVVAGDFMAFTAPAERGFTFGDLMRAPDGTVGILRGQGGMGSNRVRLVSDEANPRELGKFDFGELEGVERRGAMSGYDRIVMNPPFSNRRDAEHVMHAYKLLKPGGRVVAIMGEGVFFGKDKKAQDFRDWLDSVGGTSEKLPPGSFMDPSLPVNTGANARMVSIDKPASTGSQDDAPAFSRSSSNERAAPTFYSELARQIEKSPMKQGLAGAWNQYLDALAKRGAIKADEVEWTGLREWLNLQDGKVSKDQIAEYLDANGVQVTETVLGAGSLPQDWVVEEHRGGFVVIDDTGETRGEGPTPEEAISDSIGQGYDGTKYSQYTLPGGTNYREVLLTLPERTATPTKDEARRDELEGKNNRGQITKAEFAELLQLRKSPRADDRVNYKSSHWDQPNVLAHIRVNDRESVEPMTEQQRADNAKRAEMLARADAIAQKIARGARDARIAGDIRREELLAELRPLVRAGKMTPVEMTRRLDDAAFSESGPEMAAMIREREQIMASLPPEHKPRTLRVLFVEELQSDFQQDYRKAKQQVKAAVEADFTGIVERMKKAGVLEVNCD